MTIETGGGSDTIDSSYGENLTIDAGEGNDSIEVLGENYYIRGGKGNDSVNLRNKSNSTEYVYEYALGDGDDVVSRDAFISLIDGATIDYTLISGSDLILKIGEGSITVKDYVGSGDDIEIPTIDSDNKDYYLGYDEVQSNTYSSVVRVENRNHKNSKIRAEGTVCTIQGGNGKDTIVAPKTGSTKNSIDGGPGRDVIYNNGADTTIDGGSGDDEIINGGIIEYIFDCPPETPNNSVKGGLGNDSIFNNGSNCTVEGNEGRDFINNYGNNAKVNGGADNDSLASAELLYDAGIIRKGKLNTELLNAYPHLKTFMDMEALGPPSTNTAEKFSKLKSGLVIEKYTAALELGKMANEAQTNANELGEKLGTKVAKATKALKWLKGVGTVIEAGEFLWVTGDAIFNPGEGKWDKVVDKGIDVGTSFIPVPGVDMVVGAVLKETYKWSANAIRNNFAKANPVSSSYNQLMEFYGNSSNEIMSYETLEEFYMNTPNIEVVIGGEGNDVILNNKRDNVCIDGGEDDDVIKNYNSSNVKVNGNKGNDFIINLNSPNTTITGDTGNDYIISNYSANVTIDAGAGNNSVSVYDSNNVSIITGNGDNSISNLSKHVSIYTGAGDDNIFNIGAHVLISSGDGSDTIESVGDEVTLKSGDGDSYVSVSGNNVIITMGSGLNSIDTNEFYYGLIQTGDSADYITNFGNSSTIEAGSGSDSINNVGNLNKIFGGNNDDYIGSFGDANTINTGDNDDLIELIGNSNLVECGTGNDLVMIYEGSYNTINAGKGDDFIATYIENILVENMLFIYNVGDGNDFIKGFSATSTLQIGDGKDTYLIQDSGSDILVNVGEEIITLVDAASLSAINIAGTEIFKNKWTLNGTTATYGTPNEILITINGVKSLEGISLKGKVVTVSSAALDGKDVTISGLGYTLALGNDVPVPTALAPTWTVNDTNTTLYSNTSAGYTLENNKIVYNAKKKGDAQITLGNLVKNATLALPQKNTLTLNANVLGTNTSIESNAGGYTIKLTGDMKGKKFVGTSKSDTLSIAAQNVSVEGDKGNDKLVGSANNDSLNGGSGNDTLSGGAGKDKLFGQSGNDSLNGGKGNDSLNGGSGNDILSGGSGNDTLIGSTGNDSLHGGTGKDLFVFSVGKDTIADYKSGTDKISVSSSLGNAVFSVANNNIVLTYGKNSLTILDGSDKVITFADNTKFVYTQYGRFNQNKTSVTLSAASKNFSATKYNDLATIDGLAAVSPIKITGNGLNNSILGGAGKDKLYGSTGNDSLNGGKGNDSLNGGSGNDILSGGSGNDTLIGSTGKDSLSGGSGKDKLYGGAGNDTLWDGAGNDTLYGGDGKDTFIYKPGEGTDKIMDYNSADMLQILKADGSAGGSFNKSFFSNNKLTLTIDGGGTVIFDGVKSGDVFNINGTTHIISGKKLK